MTCTNPSISQSRSKILSNLFIFFKKHQVPYCVIGILDDLAEKNSIHDIDIVIDEAYINQITQLLMHFSDENQISLIQSLQHEQTAFYFIFSWFNETDHLEYLHLDVCSHYLRHGSLFIKAEEFLQNRVLVADNHMESFFVPSSEISLVYYLIKKIGKQHLNDSQIYYLSQQFHKDPEKAKKQIRRFWPEEKALALINALDSNSWEKIKNSFSIFYPAVPIKNKLNPELIFGELQRKIKRYIQPSGIWIAFLGPDGSGKSTIIKEISTSLAPGFRRYKQFHLKPELGYQAVHRINAPVKSPHQQKPRSFISSLIKIIYFYLIYTFGYWFLIKPMLVRSTFIIFDRYYHDLLVDPIRYRYSGSMFMARLIGEVVPKPDLFVLLNAPPEVLQTRKQEVAFEESARQQQAYLKLIENQQNAIIVNASQPVHQVCQEINQAVVNFMTNRVKRYARL